MAVSPLESRYKTEMNALFDEQAKLKSWLEVEVALAYAHAKLGNIPIEAAKEIEQAAGKVELARVEEIEAEIHHDLMAMVRALSEKCRKHGGYVHLGATSYDIEDTAAALTLKRAIQIIRKRLLAAKAILKQHALQRKSLVCVARTHGQHAVPTTYGMKFALWFAEVERHLERLDSAEEAISVGKMSGAAGTMATFQGKGYEIQSIVMESLGLKPDKVTNQVVQRDRHAQVLFALALIACTLEKIAKEIRNLQRTEIMEVAEPFASKQVGSSTMPQKRNPHKCERVCSLARIVRSNLQVALENIPLEHERDLTNSANERFIFAESFIVTDYMLLEMNKILAGLQFFPENIERNLELTSGAIMAERVMIALTEKGMGRQEAHELIRNCSMEAFRDKSKLFDVLLSKPEVARLISKEELASLFQPKNYIGEAVEIVERAVGAE
ncbi:MAG: adenylosuccinate lyase [Candidatus Micrarchaeota archaeon]|nr:adenylosuccinate lyase [Candidatus Micrarchaeota archaeon]